jgi:hypothetical protein
MIGFSFPPRRGDGFQNRSDYILIPLSRDEKIPQIAAPFLEVRI